CKADKVLDASLNIGKVQPNLDAAEVRSFGANGRGDAGAKVAGRPDVTGEFGLRRAKLRNLIHRSVVDLFLGVEAGAHGPFVKQVEERAGLDQANGLGVGEEIQRDFVRHAAIQ